MLYDKGDYHMGTIGQYGLPESHAYHHTLYFLRWLIEHRLMSDEFRHETDYFNSGNGTNEAVLKIYEEMCDYCLIDDMLSDEGNAFAMAYFDFEKGQYIHDYIRLLQGNLPSEFHIALTEENYEKLKQVIDRRYAEWKNSTRGTEKPGAGSSKPKRWWEFWRN